MAMTAAMSPSLSALLSSLYDEEAQVKALGGPTRNDTIPYSQSAVDAYNANPLVSKVAQDYAAAQQAYGKSVGLRTPGIGGNLVPGGSISSTDILNSLGGGTQFENMFSPNGMQSDVGPVRYTDPNSGGLLGKIGQSMAAHPLLTVGSFLASAGLGNALMGAGEVAGAGSAAAAASPFDAAANYGADFSGFAGAAGTSAPATIGANGLSSLLSGAGATTSFLGPMENLAQTSTQAFPAPPPPPVSSGSTFSNLLSGAGNKLGITGPNSLIGTAAGTPLAGSVGPTTGSGITGFATGGGLPALSSAGVGGGSSAFSNIASLLGGVNSLYANDQAQKDLLKANQAAQAQIAPYTASGAAANSKLSELLGTGGDASAADSGSLIKPFTPDDLTQDPGYQFNLQQGNQALDRQAAAKGSYFSGAALKDAQTFGQGLADNTYNNAFSRYLTQNNDTYSKLAGQAGAGQTAATTAGNLAQNTGNAQASSGISASNILNQSLSGLLSGNGAKRPVNIGGQVVYM